MKKSIFIVFITIVSAIQVFAQVQYRQTASGMKFYLAKDEQGPTAKMGQLVSMHMSIKDANGTYIKNTYKDAKPMLFPVKLSLFDGDIYEAVGMLSKGDSALFKIPADSMYNRIFRKEMPKELKKGSMLDVTISVFDIWDQQERFEELKAHADTAISASEKSRRAKEDVQIQNYIRRLGFQMDKTPLGVYYTYYSKGIGTSTAKEGSVVVINFVGKLMDDTEFETTFDADNIGKPYSFVLGKREVISGWENILTGVHEGDKILCIIPSHLAFGAQQKGNVIPANSVLIFEIDVMGVR